MPISGASRFLPSEFGVDALRLLKPVGKANAILSKYDGILYGMVNPAVLLSPLTYREAELSSRIEGTVATTDEVMQLEAGQKFDEEKTQDIHEIINYRKTLLFAEEWLESEQPYSLFFIKALHEKLMQGVRGKNKDPGKFRDTQNWIGPKGSLIEDARFVPPDPLILNEHLEDWQRFLSEDEQEVLIQVSILHAQFEIIHPFLDGNGRIGRLIIPLFLYHKRVLTRPMFYLSEYLEENDDEYRHRLLMITENEDWQGWIEFFLRAITEQARVNLEKAKKLLQLYDNLKGEFSDATRSQYSIAALDAFFLKPIISSTEFDKTSSINNRGTAISILKKLEEAGLIDTIKASRGTSPAIYAMSKLLNLAEGKTVF